MQRAFQISIIAPITALAFTLSACASEADETPDITEAIPLGNDSASAADTPGEGSTDGAANAGAATDGDLAAEHSNQSGRNNNASPSGTVNDRQNRTVPDTMEAGSNPPGMTRPPAGSKVQRIN